MARSLPPIDRRGRLRKRDRKAHPKLFALRDRFAKASKGAPARGGRGRGLPAFDRRIILLGLCVLLAVLGLLKSDGLL